jgi:hypothetical protein
VVVLKQNVLRGVLYDYGSKYIIVCESIRNFVRPCVFKMHFEMERSHSSLLWSSNVPIIFLNASMIVYEVSLSFVCLFERS